MEKFVCIHGHFYQPPRENPWLEEIELQDSAYPYHDWNERINAECYAPNTASRILTPDGKVVVIGNNYAKISFNFGPTLLSWMEKHARDIYDEILDADRRSREQFSGHGSALAQAYNHMIMPLANRRDKYTQVLWGIRDFRKRFSRDPEGMWLPETAVDLETLDIMAEQGIAFTLLSPYQAKRVRPLSGHQWQDVTGGKVDPKMPYRCALPSGRTITLFFYDGPIAQEIAFGGLLSNGERFANKLLSAFAENGMPQQLVHTATDGETYGHHHKYGDMALGYCLRHIETNNLARLTNYGEYLERFPPAHEAEIFENSSWSCAHGVERWRSDCGCSTGTHPGWKQEWRRPLREALDWLRNTLALMYEEEGSRLLSDPWAARNDYISVILDRSPENVDRFIGEHARGDARGDRRTRLLKLLEMQRDAMLMFTSCGWFFDEMSGIETVQVLQYACRAIQLAQEISGISLEPLFLKYLETAPTNIPEFGNGARIYALFAKPARVDFIRLGAHYAISALFDEYPEDIRIYCYSANADIYTKRQSGPSKLFICRARLRSEITEEEARFSSAALHLGDHNINCGVRNYISDEASDSMHREILERFDQGNILEVLKSMEKYFGTHNYSIEDLFKDEQRTLLDKVVQPTFDAIDSSLGQVCDNNCLIIDFYNAVRVPVPRKLLSIISYRANSDLERSLTGELRLEEFRKLVEETKRWGLDIDRPNIGFLGSAWIDRHMERLEKDHADVSLIERTGTVLELLNSISVPLNLWKAQNIYFRIDSLLHGKRKKEGQAAMGKAFSPAWVAAFHKLGAELNINEQAPR